MKTVRLPFSAGIIPALVLLAFAVGGWWIAQEWGRSSGMFPRFLGASLSDWLHWSSGYTRSNLYFEKRKP